MPKKGVKDLTGRKKRKSERDRMRNKRLRVNDSSESDVSVSSEADETNRSVRNSEPVAGPSHRVINKDVPGTSHDISEDVHEILLPSVQPLPDRPISPVPGFHDDIDEHYSNNGNDSNDEILADHTIRTSGEVMPPPPVPPILPIISSPFVRRSPRIRDLENRNLTNNSSNNNNNNNNNNGNNSQNILLVRNFIGRQPVSNDIEVSNVGTMSENCNLCNAKYFPKEKPLRGTVYRRCCELKGQSGGRLDSMVPKFSIDTFPQLIRSLLDGSHPKSRHFKENIVKYNNSLSFASIGSQIDNSVNLRRNIGSVFRINGIIHHRISNAGLGENNQRRLYGQCYVLETEEAVDERLALECHQSLDRDLLIELDRIIRSVNPYAESYRMLKDVFEDYTRDRPNEVSNVRLVFIDNPALAARRDRSNQGRYNRPLVNEVAMVFTSNTNEAVSERCVNIYPRGNDIKEMYTTHPHFVPMSYVLFFVLGNRGYWYRSGSESGISARLFYCFLLHVRNSFSPLFLGGKLFQQFVVDMYVTIEGYRLEFIKKNQKNFRIESYQGLLDFIENAAREQDANIRVGKAYILPSSFVGGPRYMLQRFLDAMALLRKYGKPDLFVTFTCNPNWQEIKDLLNGENYVNRPDIVSRVFHLKVKEFLNDILKKNVLGKVIAYCYTIEFQKRGLPHMHLLLFFDQQSKIRTPEQLATLISAEIPDPSLNRKLYDLVEKHMVHGPCEGNNNAQCRMQPGQSTNRVCSKGFPKQFSDDYVLNSNGYPIYRRLDNGRQFHRGSGENVIIIDNRWIVPFNIYLLLRYMCHINVELCSSAKAIKYLFKYIYKGHDCATIFLNPLDPNNGGILNYDEIGPFVDGRYVSAPEAIWRIFEFPLQERSHHIELLPIHMENLQSVVFREDISAVDVLQREYLDRTKLTAYFDLNRIDPNAREIFYIDIPCHYTWNNREKKWSVRRRGNTLGRLVNISPKDPRFYLRLLLLNVKGAISFQDLLTFNGNSYNNYRDVCYARGLLFDDGELYNAMRECIEVYNERQCRRFFVLILIHCEPRNAMEFYNSFKVELSRDFRSHELSDIIDDMSERRLILDIFRLLKLNNIDSFREVNLDFDHYLNLDLTNVAISGNDDAQLPEIANDQLNNLNDEQREIYNYVFSAITDINFNETKLISINAIAGSGKSFLINCIIRNLLLLGKNVISGAYTGIAANLLYGGQTLHSLFKFGLNIDETCVCGVKQGTDNYIKIQNCDILIIDECTMVSVHVLRAIERLLRESSGNNLPFGNKVVILSGDWRQLLPVIKTGRRAEIIENCLKRSEFWPQFRKFTLLNNMRIRHDPNFAQFGEFLKSIGDGTLRNSYGLGHGIVKIPNEYIVNDEQELIREIFGRDSINNLNDIFDVCFRCILCPRNIDSLRVNEQVLNLYNPTNFISRTYVSSDSACSLDESGTDVSRLFPMEVVNSFTPSGFPPHRLNLKIGSIVILLRNLNIRGNLCNGTRLIIRKFYNNLIVAQIIGNDLTRENFNNQSSSYVHIPRIDFISNATSHELPFILKRRQFPFRLSFAMTINKSQGQSFEKVGILLKCPVFSHGMLYVAFSRATRADFVKVFMDEMPPVQGRIMIGSRSLFTQNVVINEILSDD